MHRRLPLLLGLACLFAAGASHSQAEAAKPSAPVFTFAGTIERGKVITSRHTGITYPYHVYLPVDYATSGKRYPVMYATDGQWNFWGYSHALDQRRKPMILISIEEGGDNRRETDFFPDGAPAYGRFLKEELAPLVERSYRTTGERTYAGASLGGLLGALMLSTDDASAPFFRNYLLFDGSFFLLGDKNLKDEEARLAASRQLPVRLILSGATQQGNDKVTAELAARYEGRSYAGLQVHRKTFDVHHNHIAKPSFDWAIDLID
ncbi:alpha/beta hydrolase-fold protein [Roseateles asaccharophilus]|uniref:Alpha/beta superfamily hydrolase n=1 Tax=Roseateles asaccharophilus TaxID=582607 RepID=A0ABU2A3Q4_9BURK|nr:alpha/beta hydrolase-fold protein [Roseateles asaccharophilus]MDR7331817.1 putative alpha/beta superfamily hydrolase [Roseateles asaccharophilus]